MKSSRKKMKIFLVLTSIWSGISSVENKVSLSSVFLNTHLVRSSTLEHIRWKSRNVCQVLASICKLISSVKDLAPLPWEISHKTPFPRLRTVSNHWSSNLLLQISTTARTISTRISTQHTETLVRPFSVQTKRPSWIRTGVLTKETLNQAPASTQPSLTLLVHSEWAL